MLMLQIFEMDRNKKCYRENQISQLIVSSIVQQDLIEGMNKYMFPKNLVAQVCIKKSQQIQNALIEVSLQKPIYPKQNLVQVQQVIPKPMVFKVKRHSKHKSFSIINRRDSTLTNNHHPQKSSIQLIKSTSINTVLEQEDQTCCNQDKLQLVKCNNEDGVRQNSEYSNLTTSNNLSSTIFQFVMRSQKEKFQRNYREKKMKQKISVSDSKNPSLANFLSKFQTKKIKQQPGKKFIFSMNTDYNGNLIPSSKKPYTRPNPTFIDVDYSIHQDEKQIQRRKNDSTLKNSQITSKNSKIQKLDLIQDINRFNRVMSLQQKSLDMQQKERDKISGQIYAITKQNIKIIPKNVSFEQLEQIKKIKNQSDALPVQQTLNEQNRNNKSLIKKKKQVVFKSSTRPHIFNHSRFGQKSLKEQLDAYQSSKYIQMNLSQKQKSRNNYQSQKKQNIQVGSNSAVNYLINGDKDFRKKVTFSCSVQMFQQQ